MHNLKEITIKGITAGIFIRKKSFTILIGRANLDRVYLGLSTGITNLDIGRFVNPHREGFYFTMGFNQKSSTDKCLIHISIPFRKVKVLNV